MSNGILIQIFPLHDTEELKKLKHTWYGKMRLSYQPLGKLVFLSLEEMTECLQDHI